MRKNKAGEVMATATTDTAYPFIDGQSVRTGSTGDTFSVVNPSTEEVFRDVASCDANQVDQAVNAAAAAQAGWANLRPDARGVLIARWGLALMEHREELAALDTHEMGKPIGDSVKQAGGTATLCRYWAGMADKICGDAIPTEPGYLSYTKREPLGVTGVIIPWNGPIHTVVARVAPSIACGNSVVVKPSEYSPSSALRAAELAIAAGIPAGVVNVLTGAGEVGALLAEHAGVGGLSFTGSVVTGRKVNLSAAQTFKKVTLELGGKSANIVFADADIEKALRGATWGVFSNSGQVCCAGTRLIVERKIAAEFVERLKAAARRVRLGDPMRPETQIGPLVSRTQYDRVQSYIDIGRHEATLELGGRHPDEFPRGFYVEPTIFTDAEPSMRISQEEIFGPVLTVLAFDTEEEALKLANDVEYGLSASVWTSDVGRMLRVSERVEAGTVWGNTSRLLTAALPFGGFKDSGLGNASGEGAIEGNTRIRRISVLFDRAAVAPGWDD